MTRGSRVNSPVNHLTETDYSNSKTYHTQEMIREVNYVQSHTASTWLKAANVTQKHAFLTNGSQVEFSFISAVGRKTSLKPT